jgi:uncharacterized protein YbjT (DUF2867 family)
MAKNIVTIFGGGGFIGRYVVRLLAQHDWVIRIAQRRPDAARFLIPAGNIGQIDLVQANIRDLSSVQRAIKGSNAVVNLVGILAPSGRQLFSTVHSQGPAHIADAASKYGVDKLVHLSALGADPRSSSRYAQSKALGEEAIMRRFPKATLLRPSIVYGPEDQFFNRFARMTRFSPFLPLIGGGETRFQPTHVSDVARAVFHALVEPQAEGKIFELGGHEPISFKDLMILMLREIGKRRCLLPIPYAFAYPLAFFLQGLPGAPLTVDQIRLLKNDNILSGRYPGYQDLQIEPLALSSILLSYLSIYR